MSRSVDSVQRKRENKKRKFAQEWFETDAETGEEKEKSKSSRVERRTSQECLLHEHKRQKESDRHDEQACSLLRKVVDYVSFSECEFSESADFRRDLFI